MRRVSIHSYDAALTLSFQAAVFSGGDGGRRVEEYRLVAMRYWRVLQRPDQRLRRLHLVLWSGWGWYGNDLLGLRFFFFFFFKAIGRRRRSWEKRNGKRRRWREENGDEGRGREELREQEREEEKEEEELREQEGEEEEKLREQEREEKE